MEKTIVDGAITEAARAAQSSDDYKSETYFAVLLAGLLRGVYEIAHAPNSAGHDPARPKSPDDSEKPYSPGELFASKEWSTEVDKVVIAGHFLEHYKKLSSFTIENIRTCLISAKVSLPKNVNLAIFQAVQRSWMMEVPAENTKKKAWSLTQSGQRRVAEMNEKKTK
jgi:hypothetical protein